MRYTDIFLFIANVLVKLCFILVTEIILLILGQRKIAWKERCAFSKTWCLSIIRSCHF